MTWRPLTGYDPNPNLYGSPVRLTGGRSAIERWPEPIHPEEDGKCGICLEDLQRTVQLQCCHVMCNVCLQKSMAEEENHQRCPFCRREIYEYRSLCSGRIRRPRDRTVPIADGMQYTTYDESLDHDYVPQRYRLIHETDSDDTSGQEESPLRRQVVDDQQAVQDVENQSDQLVIDENFRPPSRLSSSHESQASVVIIGEWPRRVQPLGTERRSVDHDDRSRSTTSSRSQSQPSVVIIGEYPPPQQAPNSQDLGSESQQQGSNTQQAPQEFDHNRYQEIEFVEVRAIVDYRGRGRNIRYLVEYMDGERRWEPLRHLVDCPRSLETFRRRLHVIQVQKSRARSRERRDSR